MTYLVMETFETYAVLLSDNGQFVKAANLNYKVGQTVTNPVLMREEADQEKQEKVVPFTKKKGFIAATILVAAAMLVFVFTGIGNRTPQQMLADSSIYLIINPEVRLDLDEEGNVIRIEGTNPDGRELVEGYELTSQDRMVVTTDLIDRAIEMGFLTEGDQISFRIDASTEQFQEYGVELRSTITEYLDGRMSVTIEITNDRNNETETIEEESSRPPQESESTQTPPPIEMDEEDDDDDDDDEEDDDDDDDDDD